jgi:3-phenylpropionate/trans-cinnamate dioxygenase ferredoxin reductase subunit
MSERIVIVGGGPAGLATARAYREAGGDGAVELVCGEPHLPYERPPLTKDLLRGESGVEELPIEEPSFYAEHDIAVRLGVRATGIHREARCLRVGGEVVRYDAVVLATGSVAVRPPIRGADDPALHTIRTVEDALAVREAAVVGARVVVVGAGFIACEAAASLARRGVQTTLVAPEEVPQAPRLGDRAGELLAEWLAEAEGVDVRLGTEIEAVSPHELLLAGGERVPADLIVLATGVRPASELAADAELELEDGAIAVDEHMRTADLAVLAVGDVAAAVNLAAGRRLHVEHWGDALAHGEIAGRVLAGEDASWSSAPGFWSTVGDHTLKHAAWGDGFDQAAVEADGDGRLVVRYLRDGATVGLLAVGDDDAYEAAQAELERRA